MPLHPDLSATHGETGRSPREIRHLPMHTNEPLSAPPQAVELRLHSVPLLPLTLCQLFQSEAN